MEEDYCEENDFEIENIESENKDKEIDNASYKIHTYGADFPLQTLFDKIKDKDIIVPTWQRRYVWNVNRASKLIESFLLGLPVPQIFLYNEEESQDLLVVDGQQRLKTIYYFFNGEFEDGTTFYLKNVHQKWEGKRFEELDEVDKKRLKNCLLRATIFEQTDPKDDSSIFEIFNRLNTGGMLLTEQEIRNCVIRGKINNFLNNLNLYENWRKLLNKPAPDTRMRDVEMILRFLALYEGWREYKKPMKDFLSEYMKNNKNLENGRALFLSEVFKKTIDNIYNNIGTSAFKIKAGINIAVLDSVCVSIATLGNDLSSELKDNFDKLKVNAAYIDSISKSTTDSDRVESRIKIALNIFKKNDFK